MLEDLALLRNTWNDDIAPARLRNDSAILRKLLIHGDLARAWRDSGRQGEPRVTAPDLKHYLGDFDRKKIVLAQAGGATYRGLTLALNMVVEGAVSPGAHYPEGESPFKELPLSRFVDGPTIVAGGVAVKRSDLIKYVANKMGGAHFDETRKATDMAFKALDGLPQQIVWNGAGDFDIRHYEMLAIGQLVVTSAPIASWMNECGQTAPE